MNARDIDQVIAIENENYAHPWTLGNFRDSLNAGYHCWLMECAGEIVGYGVVMIAVDEAHLLNLCIAAEWQRRGLGREMLRFLTTFVRGLVVDKVYLEVRPSNIVGRGLYASAGFVEIVTRRGYYPAHDGREDAIVMELALK